MRQEVGAAEGAPRPGRVGERSENPLGFAPPALPLSSGEAVSPASVPQFPQLKSVCGGILALVSQGAWRAGPREELG